MQGCESVLSTHVVSGDPPCRKSHFTEDTAWSVMQHSVEYLPRWLSQSPVPSGQAQPCPLLNSEPP